MSDKFDFMKLALELAKEAADDGEVPVGAVIVRNGEVVSTGRNRREKSKNALLHAEIEAIDSACKKLGGWRLSGCSMYVTLEPCSMCAGALVWSRMENLYIGTKDPKAGACGSVFNIAESDELNHHIHVEYGLMEQECSEILKEFFRGLREQ